MVNFFSSQIKTFTKMENRKKLIIANLYALLALVIILTGSRMTGINFDSLSGAFVLKLVLILMPQACFFYFYLKSYRMEKSRVRS
jgi:hypothetical protein